MAGRLFAGSGLSRRFRSPEAFCLEADTGRVVWRQATDLPVWGSPVVAGDAVLFGLGNGRLLESAPPPEKPAGGLLCLDAKSGHVRWRHRTPDAVFGRCSVAGEQVWFTCRDGTCRCLDLATGQLVWKRALGSPAVTTPAVVGDRVYAVALGGQVRCLEAATGQVLWQHDLAPEREARMIASPVIVRDRDRRQVLVGGELRGGRQRAVLYCLEETEPAGGPLP
jgi:outer membrane protein assembly factor BamB